jgi:hypothetical protein
MAEPLPLLPGRRVGLLLGAAILFAPWAFAWFTLRKGYSDRAKQVAFGWAAVFVVLLILQKHGLVTRVNPQMSSSAPTSEGPATIEANDAARNALTRILTTDLERVPTALDEMDAATKAKNWIVVKERLSYLAELFEPLRGVRLAVTGTDKKTGKQVPGVTSFVEQMRDRYEAQISALKKLEAPSPVGADITPERAVEVIKARCGPLVTRYTIRPQNCSIHANPQVWIGSVPAIVGKPTFVSYVASDSPSPEWFVSEDGRWWTANGVAGAACPSMPEFRDYIHEKELATLARRGSDRKSYEGVFDRNGNWKFQDCSEFEVKVANIVQDELFKNPDEDEERALKRAAQMVGLTKKVASDIYAKTTSQCPYSLGKSK